MKKHRYLSAWAAAAGMLVLIADGKTALQGASEGVTMCIQTLIPSLFPFFVLSNVITSTLSSQKLPFLRPIGKIFQIPEGSEFLLAVGFLGGYPVGARNVSQLYRNQHLSKSDAEGMIMICNQAGPSFLFGIVGPMFSRPEAVWSLWLIQILSTFAVARMLPCPQTKKTKAPSPQSATYPQQLQNAIQAMASVCGWVVLLRMVWKILMRWVLWLFPQMLQIGLAGAIELANGCLLLPQLSSEQMRFLFAAGLLSFGGGCVLLQTKSVCNGLSMKIYFPGKILQSAISTGLAAIMVGYVRLYWLLPVSLLIGGSGLKRCYCKKRSSIPRPAVV